MNAIRTIISLDPEQKAWLDGLARETGKSMTAIVREALAAYRAQQNRKRKPVLDDLLAQTSGTWKKGDGLAWQRRLRDEWDDR